MAVAMRHVIGSFSKEFAASALLLLQESGRVSIDNPAGKWITGLGPPQARASVLYSHILPVPATTSAESPEFWKADNRSGLSS